MVVLTRTRKSAGLLLTALRACGIAYVPEGLDSLAVRPAARDLRSLTRFLLHRGDRLSGLAVLRSPLVGLTLADLASLVEPDVVRALTARSDTEHGSGNLQSITELLSSGAERLSADGRLRVERFVGVLSSIRAEIGRRRVCDLVEGAWVALGGPAVAGVAGAADAQAYLSSLAEIEGAGTVDLVELDRRLDATPAPSGGAAQADLSIMTMHAAKGLEFDTVVLLGLGRVPGSPGGNAPLVFETEPRSGAMNALALEKARGAEHADDLKYALIAHRENARGRAETLRLLYVGATRARHRLVFSAAEPKLDKEGDHSPASSSLLYRIKLAGGMDAARVETVNVSGDSASAAMPRLEAGSPLPAPPASAPVRLRHDSRPSDVEREITPDTSGVVSLRRNAGITAHLFLERIAKEGASDWDVERVDSVRSRIRAHLTRLGTSEEQLDQAEEIVVRALRRTLGDSTGQWLLAEHEAARCEWKLSLWDGGESRVDGSVDQTNASLDRTFIADNMRWIVDYKVIEPPAKMDEETFITEKVAAYREQLESYGRLVGELEPERPIRLALYFPLIGRFACWEPGSSETDTSSRSV